VDTLPRPFVEYVLARILKKCGGVAKTTTADVRSTVWYDLGGKGRPAESFREVSRSKCVISDMAGPAGVFFKRGGLTECCYIVPLQT
jgi:hypothetical protein